MAASRDAYLMPLAARHEQKVACAHPEHPVGDVHLALAVYDQVEGCGRRGGVVDYFRPEWKKAPGIDGGAQLSLGEKVADPIHIAPSV